MGPVVHAGLAAVLGTIRGGEKNRARVVMQRLNIGMTGIMSQIIVLSARKISTNLAPIHTAEAQFDTKFTGIIFRNTAALAKDGMRKNVRTHTAAGLLEFTPTGQMSQGIVRARDGTPLAVLTRNAVER